MVFWKIKSVTPRTYKKSKNATFDIDFIHKINYTVGPNGEFIGYAEVWSSNKECVIAKEYHLT